MVYDASEIIDAEDMRNQLCPFCDNEMQDYEQVTVIKAHGSLGLAHSICIVTERDG